MYFGNVAELAFGFAAQGIGERLGVLWKVLEEDALLIAIALHAARVIEKARFAAQAQAIETGECEQDQSMEAR